MLDKNGVKLHKNGFVKFITHKDGCGFPIGQIISIRKDTAVANFETKYGAHYHGVFYSKDIECVTDGEAMLIFLERK